MNTSSQISSPRPRLHPLVAVAACAVIALCLAGVAAIMGWLPSPSANQQGTSPGSQAVAQATTPPAASQPAQSQPSGSGTRPQPASGAAPVSAASQASCRNCGVVESTHQVQVPVEDTGNHLVGTIGGGVVGGVVGNQFGHGGGKTAMTVLGAAGGALAGREVERNIKRKTVTHYQLTVRMNDGSTRQFHSEEPFGFASGDHVRVENNKLLPG